MPGVGRRSTRRGCSGLRECSGVRAWRASALELCSGAEQSSEGARRRTRPRLPASRGNKTRRAGYAHRPACSSQTERTAVSNALDRRAMPKDDRAVRCGARALPLRSSSACALSTAAGRGARQLSFATLELHAREHELAPQEARAQPAPRRSRSAPSVVLLERTLEAAAPARATSLDSRSSKRCT